MRSRPSPPPPAGPLAAPRSGATPEVPGLLKYACVLHTNVRLLPAARVDVPSAAGPGPGVSAGAGAGADDAAGLEHLGPVLGGRPLVTLEFSNMEVSRTAGEAAEGVKGSSEEERPGGWVGRP